MVIGKDGAGTGSDDSADRLDGTHEGGRVERDAAEPRRQKGEELVLFGDRPAAVTRAVAVGDLPPAAREVATEGIRVNGVAVGLVDTDFHVSAGEPGRPDRIRPTVPMQRSGAPEEIAAAIVWLLSDAASYTTGTVLAVSGGR